MLSLLLLCSTYLCIFLRVTVLIQTNICTNNLTAARTVTGGSMCACMHVKKVQYPVPVAIVTINLIIVIYSYVETQWGKGKQRRQVGEGVRGLG